MRIDVHAHYFPEEYLDLLDEYGSDFTGVARGLMAGNADGEIEARLATMDRNGVQMQILSATPQLPTFAEKEHAVDAARRANDLYKELLDRYPDRFAAFAATPLPHGEAAAEEAARAIDELGFLGATVGTEVDGRTLDDPDFEPLWKALDERGAALYVHASGRDIRSDQIKEKGLTWIVGAPIEDAVGILHFVRAGITARYPSIKVIVAHLGGPLPFLAQRIDDNYLHWGEGFPELPSDTWKKMWWDTPNFHPPALRCAIDTFGETQVLLGSDFPYFRDQLYDRCVDYIAHSDLDQRVVDLIRDQNTAKLFGLGNGS